MSYFGRFIPYIRGLLLWPAPLDHGLSHPLWREGSWEEASEGGHHSITIPEVALPGLGVHGFSYWALAWALQPLSRAIHSRQMELVGGLLCTSRSPSHGSTSNVPTGKVGRAPGKDCTTNAHTWGYFCCSAYDSYCSTSWFFYIRAFHHHLGFGVSRPCAYLSDTYHHTYSSLLANGWDVCPSGPADYYTPPNSTAPKTFASAST